MASLAGPGQILLHEAQDGFRQRLPWVGVFSREERAYRRMCSGNSTASAQWSAFT